MKALRTEALRAKALRAEALLAKVPDVEALRTKVMVKVALEKSCLQLGRDWPFTNLLRFLSPHEHGNDV